MTTSIITRGSGVSVAGRQSRGLSPAFSRASAAYQSDGRLVGVGVPRFETVDGRRGVLVEEGTTNLIAASGSGVNLTTWGDLYTVTKTIEGDWYRIAFDPSRANSGIRGYVNLAALTNNAAYVCSVDLRNDGDKSVTIHLDWCDGGSKVITVEPGQTVRAATSPYAQEYTSVYRFFDIVRTAAGGSILMRFPQVERKPYATSFVEGTRDAELLTLPTAGVLGPNEGTWEQRVYVPALSSLPDNACMFHIPRPGGENGFRVQYRTGGPVFELRSHTDDGTKYTNLTTPAAPYANGWHHFVATWQPDAVRFFIDGALKGSASAPKLLTVFDSIARVGHMFAGGVYTLNSCHSDLRVHCRALTADEIAAHAAGSIVASDCYHYPFDGDLWPTPGSLGAVMARSIITRPGKLEVIRR